MKSKVGNVHGKRRLTAGVTMVNEIKEELSVKKTPYTSPEEV